MCSTQHNCCVVIEKFDKDGKLPPGIHWTNWNELCGRFGWTEHRRRLLEGLKGAVENLKSAGCRFVYLDGSFVTSKETPGDFDACWDTDGVKGQLLDPVLLTFHDKRVAQKMKYFGELFPASNLNGNSGYTFLDFFQIDKETGDPKGIVGIDLGVGF